MNDKTYRVKAFEWQSQPDDIEEVYRVHVGFGAYKVSRHREGFEENGDWQCWRWEYMFDEYYDEESFECDSAEDGKAKAWENWLGRLLPALEEVAHNPKGR